MRQITTAYTAHDLERRHTEAPKGSQMEGGTPDHRSAFSRDRARVLHCAALRRLADKTQVVGPRDGDTPRTRLTHSLEVAQIARGIGQGLGVDPDLAELAALCHDIGHPPFGHNGEVALNEVARGCGGFEGNAQTLRIVTRLEPKVIVQQAAEDAAPGGAKVLRSYGLNLTRASLDAACKYPWVRTAADGTPRRKYGCYDEDAHILQWIRGGVPDVGARPPLPGQIMDASDDMAYSVHDVEDGVLSGHIDLKVLWDLVELAALAEKGAKVYGGDPAELVDAAGRLRQLDVVARAADFAGSFADMAALKAMTSELVGRFVGATIRATRQHGAARLGAAAAPQELVVPAAVSAEVTLLKTVAVLYVMDDPGHLRRQDRQRDRIFSVYDYLVMGAPGTLDPAFRQWFEQAKTDAERQRVVVDQIASMTESRLERVARSAAGMSEFYS